MNTVWQIETISTNKSYHQVGILLVCGRDIILGKERSSHN